MKPGPCRACGPTLPDTKVAVNKSGHYLHFNGIIFFINVASNSMFDTIFIICCNDAILLLGVKFILWGARDECRLMVVPDNFNKTPRSFDTALL